MFGVKLPIKHDWQNLHRFQHSNNALFGNLKAKDQLRDLGIEGMIK
jgi:hypothetical protein